MHIGIDGRSLLEAHPTGVSVYAYEMIRALVQLAPQHTWHIFTSGRSAQLHQAPLLHALRTDPSLAGRIQWHHLALPNKLFHLLSWLKIGPRINQVLQQCDVVLAPNLHFLPIARSVPYVVTVHDLSFVLFPECLSLRRRLWHAVINPRQRLQRAKHIIAVSDATRRDVMATYHILPEQISVVPSAIPTMAATSKAPHTAPHQPYWLCVGTLEPRKNLTIFLQAYYTYRQRSSHPLALVIVGDRGWKSDHLAQQITTIPDVRYYEYVSPAEKRWLMEHAQALIYPSVYEGFGFPPLEAFALGTPVIASWAGALPEVLGPAALYVDPYAQADMVQALLQAESAPWRVEYAQRGRTQAQHYNWTESARLTLQILEQAV